MSTKSRFDFYCSTVWYAEHLWPIWQALDPDERGRFFQPFRNTGLGVFEPKRGKPLGSGNVAVVASNYDQLFYAENYPAVARFEHGCGYSYHGTTNNPSYAGGREVTKNVKLLPATNRWVRNANLRAFPDIPGPIVGCPKLDGYVQRFREPREGDTVAISFHWDCHVAPEARSAFMSYRRVLPELAKKYKLIGHGHPRAWTMLKNWYAGRGIEPVESFQEVCERAAVYVCDSSSTIYEFAALNRPVVLMNAPWYRKEVHHGIRFWDRADVGIQVDGFGELDGAIEEALQDLPEQRAKRHAAVEEVFPLLGRSSPAAAEALRTIGLGA